MGRFYLQCIKKILEQKFKKKSVFIIYFCSVYVTHVFFNYNPIILFTEGNIYRTNKFFNVFIAGSIIFTSKLTLYLLCRPCTMLRNWSIIRWWITFFSLFLVVSQAFIYYKCKPKLHKGHFSTDEYKD